MTTGDVVYSLRFSLIKIWPEPGFDLGSTAGESGVLTARLPMLYVGIIETVIKKIYIIMNNLWKIHKSYILNQFQLSLTNLKINTYLSQVTLRMSMVSNIRARTLKMM